MKNSTRKLFEGHFEVWKICK